MKYASLRQGLIGAWVPSLGPSGNTLLDRSGYGNHGTLTNMDAGTDWVGSRYGWALDFDGVNDYIDLTTRFWNQVGSFSQLSFSVWFLSNGKSNHGITGTSNFGAFSIYSNAPTNLRFLIGSTSNLLDAGIAVGRLHHACACYDGAIAKLFLDGQEISSRAVTGTFSNAGGPAYFGSYYSTSFTWGGLLDDGRFYRRMLNPQEICLLASEPGIGLKPERTSVFFGADLFSAAWLSRQSTIIGGGVA